MKLQKFSLLIFIFFLVIFVLTVNVFISLMVLSSYETLERHYIESDIRQVANKLNDELADLSRTASDWGPWSETSAFVKGENSHYISDNLQPHSYENLRLNDIIIANSTGTILYAGAYDLQNKTMVTPASFFSSSLDPDEPFMNTSDCKRITSGLLMLEDTPLLIASQPVVNSDYSGPVCGVFIVGKNLDSREVTRLKILTQANISFLPLNDPALPPDLIDKIRENTHRGAWYSEPVHHDLIRGYALLQDVYGNDALILQISKNRDIYKQGIHTALFFVFLILGGGLVLGLTIIILLHALVLKRMGTIASQVHEIGRSDASRNRVEIWGDDEMKGLSLEINRMLDTIEKTQKKLQESEEKIREVVENIPDYVVIYAHSGEILYINPAAMQATGYEAEEIIGKPIFTLSTDENREILIQAMKTRQTGQPVPPYEIEVKTKTGTRRTVLVKGRSIRYHDNPATLLLLSDITERIEYEREREKHAQELERISCSLQQANRQVNLLSSITRHDILNQVNLGLLYLDSLIMRYEEPQIRQKLEDVVSVIQTIQRQIEFTRIYEGLGMQEPQWQSLEEILSRLPARPGISVSQELEGVYVYADKMLEKVFYNLYENSLRHGQGVTRITLRYRQSAEGLIICYEDNGAGIREEEKEHVFERGYGKNTGFGLFLVREILSLTRISIRETGVYGSGARFEITVPPTIFRLDTKER